VPFPIKGEGKVSFFFFNMIEEILFHKTLKECTVIYPYLLHFHWHSKAQ
jgi:hypothetical protein